MCSGCTCKVVTTPLPAASTARPRSLRRVAGAASGPCVQARPPRARTTHARPPSPTLCTCPVQADRERRHPLRQRAMQSSPCLGLLRLNVRLLHRLAVRIEDRAADEEAARDGQQDRHGPPAGTSIDSRLRSDRVRRGRAVMSRGSAHSHHWPSATSSSANLPWSSVFARAAGDLASYDSMYFSAGHSRRRKSRTACFATGLRS